MSQYKKFTQDQFKERHQPIIEMFFPLEADEPNGLSEESIRQRQEFTLNSLGNYIAQYHSYRYYSGKDAVYKWIMDKY